MLTDRTATEPQFLTPGGYNREQRRRDGSPRGDLLLASCRSGDAIAQKIQRRYEELCAAGGEPGRVFHLAAIDRQFSDSETCVRLDRDVSGSDAFVIQCLLDPGAARSIDENYAAFFAAVRALREWGANHITGVLPYLAYARQDKPTRYTREPTTARLMADLSIAAGINRLVTWDPHSTPIHGFYSHVPVDGLEPVNLFSSLFERFRGRDDVILVAPDAGASKMITYLGRRLRLNCAIASKERPRAEVAQITEIIGDLAGKRVGIVVDDMISSGGTIYELVKKLAARHGLGEFYLAVSHNLGMDAAYERVTDLRRGYGLREMFVTNSVPQTQKFLALDFLTQVCLSDALARVINRIHYNCSISDLALRAA